MKSVGFWPPKIGHHRTFRGAFASLDYADWHITKAFLAQRACEAQSVPLKRHMHNTLRYKGLVDCKCGKNKPIPCKLDKKKPSKP